MIERKIVDRRKATIVYIDDRFNPVDKKDAQRAKVIFDDGQVVFLELGKEEKK